MSAERFGSCLAEGRPIPNLEADWDGAVALGVLGTPTIFIGDVLYDDLRTFELMRARIEEVLAGR